MTAITGLRKLWYDGEKGDVMIAQMRCVCLRKEIRNTFAQIRTIHDLCTQFCGDIPQFDYFHVEFEESCFKIVQELHPSCVIVGCNFHLGQARYSHIQVDTDLRKAYMDSKSDGGK